MIFGIHIVWFMLLVWAAAVAITWGCEYGPEIYREQKAVWQEKHPKPSAKPVFDPEKTMKIKLPKVKDPEKYEFQIVFVFDKRPVRASRRRHARE